MRHSETRKDLHLDAEPLTNDSYYYSTLEVSTRTLVSAMHKLKH